MLIVSQCDYIELVDKLDVRMAAAAVMAWLYMMK